MSNGLLECGRQLTLPIEDGTNEIHSQQVPFAAVAIPFAHDFEGFDLGIDVFNDNAFARQCTVKRLLLCRQRTIFAFFVRNLTVRVVRQQSLIAAVGQQQNSPNNRCLDHHFEQLEIMYGALFLGGTENLPCFGVNNDLRLYPVPLFLAGVPFFLFFLGRSIGLSVTSTISVRPAFAWSSNAFLPGN